MPTLTPLALAATLALTPTLSPEPPATAAVTTPASSALDEWLGFITPSPAETAWREIPWRASFWQGVVDAQIEGKPVLLWAMNGHPMGCT
ncbi:MAG: hypothetical protein HKO59_13145 [Phycisphaerales bacterium]|nr:hypothetical protein [Phycisphaerales bacterium]NNM26908.1 hypothetical protein [Phycisphaerales bacterium]